MTVCQANCKIGQSPPNSDFPFKGLPDWMFWAGLPGKTEGKKPTTASQKRCTHETKNGIIWGDCSYSFRGLIISTVVDSYLL